MQSQMNVRIDDNIKNLGDAILKSKGLSPSAAVRALYQEIVTSQDVPSFMKPENKGKPSAKYNAKHGAGLAWKLSGINQPDAPVDVKSLKSDYSEEMLEAYGL